MSSRAALAAILLSLSSFVASRDAGILYEVWHSRASNAMSRVRAAGGAQLTTERVIASAGALSLDDVYAVHNISGDIYNAEPQLGFYCLFRSTSPTAPLPNCSNTTETLTAHAAMLLSAGFDYIAIDVTNWPQVDVEGPTDIAVLTPIRTLFEEWLALRAVGVPTPAIAVWPCSPAGGTTWRYLLAQFYNNPVYAPLVYTQSGKQVVFLPYAGANCYDAGERALIEANGGRGNVVTVPMWALFGEAAYEQGAWGFFSPCTDGAAYTSSMLDVGACAQRATLRNGSREVVEVSASGGYMLSQCALPFAAPGHLRGLTLARLFERVLAQGAPHLFMSSFNEYIGGRQAPASGAKIAFNMGLPYDSQRAAVWVDTYAAEFSRDIEPSVEGGDAVWRVAASCVRLYKAARTCADVAQPEAEPCCSRADKLVFSSVWSLARVDGSDHLLTALAGERAALVAGGAWAERCSPIANPTAFCVDGAEPDGRDGPFMIYNSSTAGDAVGVSTRALYRCLAPSAAHFFSTDAACEGAGARESTLGWIAATPGREMLRALRRCRASAAPGDARRFHALDLPCDVPDGDGAPLGYVR